MSEAKIKKKCIRCGGIFNVLPRHFDKRLFCSSACSVRSQNEKRTEKTKEAIRSFFIDFPLSTTKDCISVLGIQSTQVRKYKSEIAAELRQEYLKIWRTK